MEAEHMTNERLLMTLEMSGYVERHTIAQTLVLLMEVAKRKLDLELSYSSMFDFCVRHLRFSENETYRRLACARLVARFPMMLEPLRVGAVTLTNIVLLRDLFTSENVAGLLEEIAWKRRKEVEAIVARLKPKPDVPDSVTLLTAQAPLVAPPTPPRPALEKVASRPLSEDRYAVSFTGSGTFVAKLEKVGGLMHQRPEGEGLVAILEWGLDLALVELEKRKLAKTTKPRKAKPSKDPSYITAATRRAVAQRDGLQCTYVSAGGMRCTTRERLELDHRHPRARGGTGDASNVRILCAAHNRYEAEKSFGREHIEERIRTAQAKRRATVSDETAKAPIASAPTLAPEHAISDETATTPVTRAELAGAPAAMVGVADAVSDETAKAPGPSSDVEDDMTTHARLRYALVKDLGFKSADVDRVVSTLAADATLWSRPLPSLVAHALRRLTDSTAPRPKP